MPIFLAAVAVVGVVGAVDYATGGATHDFLHPQAAQKNQDGRDLVDSMEELLGFDSELSQAFFGDALEGNWNRWRDQGAGKGSADYKNAETFINKWRAWKDGTWDDVGEGQQAPTEDAYARQLFNSFYDMASAKLGGSVDLTQDDRVEILALVAEGGVEEGLAFIREKISADPKYNGLTSEQIDLLVNLEFARNTDLIRGSFDPALNTQAPYASLKGSFEKFGPDVISILQNVSVNPKTIIDAFNKTPPNIATIAGDVAHEIPLGLDEQDAQTLKSARDNYSVGQDIKNAFQDIINQLLGGLIGLLTGKNPYAERNGGDDRSIADGAGVEPMNVAGKTLDRLAEEGVNLPSGFGDDMGSKKLTDLNADQALQLVNANPENLSFISGMTGELLSGGKSDVVQHLIDNVTNPEVLSTILGSNLRETIGAIIDNPEHMQNVLAHASPDIRNYAIAQMIDHGNLQEVGISEQHATEFVQALQEGGIDVNDVGTVVSMINELSDAGNASDASGKAALEALLESGALNPQLLGYMSQNLDDRAKEQLQELIESGALDGQALTNAQSLSGMISGATAVDVTGLGTPLDAATTARNNDIAGEYLGRA